MIASQNSNIRLYFWIDGAPADRIGGPWWYIDFHDSDAEAEQFLSSMRPMLKAYAIEYDPTSAPDSMDIHPPKQVSVVWCR